MYKKLIGVLALMLFFSNMMYAQWDQLSTIGITGDNILAITSGDAKVFAATNSNGIYVSADAGANWSALNSGLPAAVSIKSVLTYKDTTVFAGVTNNGVYKFSKSKGNWTKLTGGLLLPTNREYSKILIVGDTILVATRGSGIYKSSLTTTSWSLVSVSGLNQIVNDMLYIGDTMLVAGCEVTNGFHVYNKTTKSWVLYGPGFVASPKVRALAYSKDTIYAGTDNGGVYVSVVGTFVWSKIKTGLPAKATNVRHIVISNNMVTASFNGWGIYTSPLAPAAFWTSINTGISPNSNINYLHISGMNVWGAAPYGPITFNGATWLVKTTGMNSPTINGIRRYNSKLYAMTASGLYESASANGGDWLIKDLTGVGISDYLVGAQMTLAIADGRLYSEVAGTLQLVNYSGVGVDSAINIGIKGFTNLLEVKNLADTFYFAGVWEAKHGVYKTSDAGATWAQYSAFNEFENKDNVIDTIGLQREGPAGTRAIVNNLNYLNGILYSSGKNGLQISTDMSNTWFWRWGNLCVNTGNSNIRNVLARSYKGHDYVFVCTDETNGGRPRLSRTRTNYLGRTYELSNGVDYCTASPDTGIIGLAGGEIKTIAQAGEDLLWVVPGGSGVYVSYDNGYNFTSFNTNLTTTYNVNDKIYSPATDYLYLTASTGKFFRYDLMVGINWAATYPQLGVVAPTTASINVQADRQGFAYVVALPADSAAPSAAMILAGKSASGVTAISKSVVANYNTMATLNITGLTPLTNYKFYVVVRSETLKFTSIQNFAAKTPGYTVTFNVSPAIAGVKIAFNGSDSLTNASGSVVFTSVAPGLKKAYLLTSASYDTVPDSTNVTGNTIVNITLTTANAAIVAEGSKVYPNPVSDVLNVELNNALVGDLVIKVVATNGSVVKLISAVKTAGVFTQAIDMSDLAKGSYIVDIKVAGTSETISIIKE